jgi:hemoglobin/transferrin/lactoferrin receptor protein
MGALYALWSLPLAAHWSLFTGGRISLIHAAAPSDPLFDPALQQRLDQHLLAPSGSLGARFDVSEQHAVMLSVLTGFRAPNLEDFQAFGGGARGFTVPNPGLHEERAYTLELGYQLHQPRVQGSVYLFASVLSGLLVRVPGTWAGAETVDGEPVLQRQNASSAVLMGAEGELRARLSAGFYAAAAAWAVWGETTRMSETGAELVEPASKIPGPAGALRAGFEHAQSPFVAEAAISAQLPQPRLSEGDKLDVRLCPLGPEGCDRVPGYLNITARAGLRVGEHWLLSLSLENLLNVAYRTHASGAYAPGRNLVLALRGTL